LELRKSHYTQTARVFVKDLERRKGVVEFGRMG
jgi:hypothetical protein